MYRMTCIYYGLLLHVNMCINMYVHTHTYIHMHIERYMNVQKEISNILLWPLK